MPLESGARIGVYEVLGALGAGGMGEVYRAHDAALGREVAIKVLPELFAADAERLARFEREARVLASLNHPNIAAIYGLERTPTATCLVMELALGDPLATRIARGRLPIDDALPIALQIAAALEAAHEKGIIHRDLKPANIVVSADGKVKVLDFGLAKLAAGDAAEAGGAGREGHDLTQSPTLAHAGTMAGVILGTAAYMSPEQARGKTVDKRADIWAFGCVLFEMLTGRQVFAGETLTDIVAAVVKNEPEWSALPIETPAGVRSVLRRCLRKDPAERLHDMADARIEIGEARTEPAALEHGVPARRGRSTFGRVLPWAMAALLAVALLVSQISARRVVSRSSGVIRLELNMPAGVEVATNGTPNVAMSADGTRVAFIGGLGGLRRLYLRRFDEFDATPLRGTELVNVCFFSPDGTALAFITSDRLLKKVSLADGLVTTVTGDADFTSGGGVWGPDDRITFGRFGALWQVSAAGGLAQRLTTLDSSRNEHLHGYPSVVAGGKAILFASVMGDDRTTTHIEGLSLATGQRREVVDKGSNPIYTSSGHLIFFRDGALLAAPFDADTLRMTGPAVAVLDNISLDQNGNPMMALSSAGSLAYVPSANATKRLVWVSRRASRSRSPTRADPIKILGLRQTNTVSSWKSPVATCGFRMWLEPRSRASRPEQRSGTHFQCGRLMAAALCFEHRPAFAGLTPMAAARTPFRPHQ